MESESSFWAIELTKGNQECTWPAETPDDEAEEEANYVLEVERACLGVSAKQNDLNVVSVSTFVNEGESTVVTPIARLKVGGKEQCRIGLQFNSQVTFKLISGNGPVHLMGLKETMYPDDSDIDDMSEEEDDSEADEMPVMPAFAAKKRPAGGAAPSAKKASRGMSALQDDDEDSEEDESDDELDIMARGKGMMAGDDDDDEDDSEDDDDEDMDDDMEDDDEDDSEEDDGDSDDEPPQLVKAAKGGKPQQQQKGKAPQQQQKGKPQQQQKQQQQQQKGKPQQPQKQQQTPQKKDNAPASVAEVMKKLQSSPNLPKKQDKFVNLVKNNFKISDPKVINDLWVQVQKNRK